MRRISLILLFLSIFLILPAVAESVQGEPIIVGETITLKSEIMGEDRRILISQPVNGQNNGPLPVLYLLDGPGHFTHTTGIIDFMAGVGIAPRMMVVGIANTDRTRDLTPATSDTSGNFPTAGGADKFMSFLTDELMPYVESNYQTRPYKILVGHSFGGLFAVNAFLNYPESFNAFVAISPSMWWDNERLANDAPEKVKAATDLQRFLYVTVGNEGPRMQDPTERLVETLKAQTNDNLQWGYLHMPDETHGTIPHRTTYDALEKLFSTWRMPQEVARNGTLEDYDKHFARLSKRFGYEIPTPENAVNQLGYRYIGAKDYDEAIRVLKRNVAKYPASSNVYDSLGDAYDAAGKIQLAHDSYKMAYEKGKATNNANTAIYKQNYERLKAKLATAGK
jgi:predicted alpha/beta superfamily hydrolase